MLLRQMTTPHIGLEYVGEASRSWAALPLTVDGAVLGAVGWSFAGRGFTPAQRVGLRSLARSGAEALFRAALFDAERRATADTTRCYALVADTSSLLDSTSDPLGAFARAARMCLPLLGEWCAIDVLGGDERLHRMMEVHIDSARDAALRRDTRRRSIVTSRRPPRRLKDGMVVNLLRLTAHSGRPGIVGLRELRFLRELGLARMLIVPLRIRGHTIGTMSFAAEDQARSYGSVELTLAERLAPRFAAAIEYARLRDSVQQAMRDRDEFVAATSHELRTPLSHIKGFVSSLRTREAAWDAQTHDDFLAEIEREADRLARLVDDLLEMSRSNTAGADSAEPAAISPATLVAAGVDRLGASLGEHSLDIRLPDDLPTVWADASQVERVIANLLDNAAKYSPPGEPISVTARSVGQALQLRVEDRGLGIHPDHVERIFEPFFREPAAGYPAKPGTGLGLAICRGLIRAQKGRIWAERSSGGGAALVFTLPVAAAGARMN
jgi:signal transduction histidine kinase